MDARPIGVFDSGVGGLTVLHECLVSMPHEDFVYLGDHARLPYGPRALGEVRGFAREIGLYLEAQDVKLIVVACNTATSAALPQLQETLAVPVIAVLTPEVHATGGSACSRHTARSSPGGTRSSCTHSMRGWSSSR
jgi:glutamate racemase